MSIREIAKRAKVSVGTVDRVIHDRGRVSEATKEKVKQIISEINYKPNFYARHLSLGKTYSFGVLMPQLLQDNEYWRLPAKGMQTAAKELEAYKVKVRFFHFDRYSEESFEKVSCQALDAGLDGLLIAPVLSKATKRLLPKIPDDCPYVFFDSTLPNTKCLCTVGQDSFQSGILAAKLMKLMVKEEGSIAIVKVLPEDVHINERMNGFLDFMSKHCRLRTQIYQADSHEGESGFRETCERIINENPDLLGVFVTNAWTSPVAENIKSLSDKCTVRIIGYDLIARNMHCLNEGDIDFIISQRPEMQGYQGIYCLYRHLVLKEKVPSNLRVPIDIVTKENLIYISS